jgi:hypothetical protein
MEQSHMATWLTDNNGNKCSVEHFGSKEAAQAALDSLKNCRDCVNCSDCSCCSHCSYCSHCSHCSHCSGCSRCSNVAYLYGKTAVKGDPDSTLAPGAPPIPKIEDIHAKIYAATSQPGALRMDQWHTCGTTHCRAGWVVHLAGDAGYALERFHNTALAAQLIYRESGYKINPGRFYDSNAEALDDMAKLAGVSGNVKERVA